MRILLVLFMLILALTGCSNTEPVATDENKEKVTSNEMKDKWQVSHNDTWKESSTLRYTFMAPGDGKEYTVSFRMGNNGRFGLYEPYGPFIAGQKQKYMWHFWGTEEELTGVFKVVAVHRNINEKVVVINEKIESLSPFNGADNHVPSNMELPKEGLWRLDVFFNEKLFGGMVVNVKKE